MAEQSITIQSIWSPPGKDFPKVINTPEQNKYHLYKDQEQLAPYLQVGRVVQLDVFETTNQQGKPISRIQNVLVDGQLVIPQGTERQGSSQTTSGEEKGMWWKELGECLRSGYIDRTTPEGKLLRKAYYAQMFTVLDIQIESKPKETTE